MHRRSSRARWSPRLWPRLPEATACAATGPASATALAQALLQKLNPGDKVRFTADTVDGTLTVMTHDPAN